MSKIIKDPFIEILPTKDVHGETSDSVRYIVNDFVQDNYKLRNKSFVIIHGKGTGILRKAVHSTLKSNKLVEKYHIYGMNDGCTIVYLSLDK